VVTESKYKELIEHAKSQCKLNKCNLDPLDLVHDAILECSSNEEYFKYIKASAKREHSRNNILVKYGTANATNYVSQIQDSEKQCKKCGEIKQSHLFPKDAIDKRDGTTIHHYICKVCAYKHVAALLKIKKYKDRTIVARQKAYWKREKEKLSDKYIYHRLLRRRFKKEEITNEMVKEKRKYLLSKKACQKWS
jgi:hypothetical protein